MESALVKDWPFDQAWYPSLNVQVPSPPPTGNTVAQAVWRGAKTASSATAADNALPLPCLLEALHPAAAMARTRTRRQAAATTHTSWQCSARTQCTDGRASFRQCCLQVATTAYLYAYPSKEEASPALEANQLSTTTSRLDLQTIASGSPTSSRKPVCEESHLAWCPRLLIRWRSRRRVAVLSGTESRQQKPQPACSLERLQPVSDAATSPPEPTASSLGLSGRGWLFFHYIT